MENSRVAGTCYADVIVERGEKLEGCWHVLRGCHCGALRNIGGRLARVTPSVLLSVVASLLEICRNYGQVLQ